MKSTSSGSGLRSVLAIASTPRSATSAPADLGLDLLLELVDAGLVLVVLEALLERRERLGRRPARAWSISRSSTPSRSRFRSVR